MVYLLAVLGVGVGLMYANDISVRNPASSLPSQYFTRKVGLSSGLLLRRSYRRVVDTLACPSQSWTLAISESCDRAFVAAVARSECTHSPLTSALTPVSKPYFRTIFR